MSGNDCSVASLIVVTAEPAQVSLMLQCVGYPDAGYPGQIRVESFSHEAPSRLSIDTSRPTCILADIRQFQKPLLEHLSEQTTGVPVLSLTDNTTSILEGYPFGCSIAGLVHVNELFSEFTLLLEQRVSEVLQLFRNPIALENQSSPASRAFQQIVDHTSDWIIIKDLQHRFVVVPEIFCQVTGLSMPEIIGKNDLQIGSSDEDVYGNKETNKKGFWKQDDEVVSTGITSVENNPEWRVFNSEIRHKSTYRVPLFNDSGEVYALLVCVKDVTEQKQNERLLSERTRMLESMTAEKQSSEFHKELAEQAVSTKSRFLAAASHDLRQPLHAMGLFLDVLEYRLQGDEELVLMGKLKESTAALYAMFSSLLDLSRLDAGMVEPDRIHIDVNDCFGVLANEFRQLAEDKGLEFKVQTENCYLLTDPTLCARIVRNLIKNAIQNTVEGSVSLSVSQVKNKVLVEITDTGCGIQTESLKSIFQEYFPSSVGGRIGLGLAIVDRMSQLLEIDVDVESEPGSGSVFRLFVPSGNATLVQDSSIAEAVAEIGNIRVLVLDDEQTILEGTEILLSLHGCTTLTADSTDMAFDVLSEAGDLPDVIVADYELGSQENGLYAITQIRVETGRHIPAILVTGDTSLERRQEAEMQNMMILHKPLRPAALVEAIRSVCGNQDATENNHQVTSFIS